MSGFSFISKDGTPLHGAVLSAPQNPKAVMTLIHGFGEHSGRYQGMADDLGAHDIAVVTCDLRGHGQSGGKRGSVKRYQDLRDDLDAVLSETRIKFSGVPHVLYGHSMGGGLVLRHLLDTPSAGHDLYGVITSAPLLKLAAPPPAAVQMIIRILRKIAPGLVLKNPIDGTKISRLADEQSAYLSDPLNHGSMNAPLAAGLFEEGAAALDAAAQWSVPMLLMHAREDQLTDFSASMDFASKAQNCDFHAFDNAEHEMHNDSTRPQIYALMRDFILAQTSRKTQS